MLVAVVEQARLFGLPDHMPGQRPYLQPSPGVELAKLCHRLL